MKDNNLPMIILAFIIGYCLQGMMKNMCGGRLFEGYENTYNIGSWIGNNYPCHEKNDCTVLPDTIKQGEVMECIGYRESTGSSPEINGYCHRPTNKSSQTVNN